MLTEKDIKILRDAADLAAFNHSQTVSIILGEALLECAEHRLSSNGGGSMKWVAALASMGEICLSLAKREEKKLRVIGVK